MTKTPSPITTECTVDAVIATTPGAVPILNAHNIDTCCGACKSIGEAAAHAHVDPVVLIGVLQAAPANSCETTPSGEDAILPIPQIQVRKNDVVTRRCLGTA